VLAQVKGDMVMDEFKVRSWWWLVVAVSKVRSWWWWCLRSGHGGGRGGSPRCIMHCMMPWWPVMCVDASCSCTGPSDKLVTLPDE